MPCLTAVETGPSIVVVSGDLAGIVLRGFHGVQVLELCVRGLGVCHLGLGPILHWGLRSWCSVVGASWSLEAVLLAALLSRNLRLFSFLSSALVLSVRMAMFIRVLKSGYI